MQILKYGNEQYAGIRDTSVVFAPGMNVVLGDNEAGKSTMISGIYDTLFMHSRLDGRKDKEFLEQKFPTGGANCIDGIVRMELDGEEIVVKKEWDKNNVHYRTDLTMTNKGEKLTGTVAEKRLQELLQFGTAIYDHIVFGRQSNETAILEWFFQFISQEAGGKPDEDIMHAREQISGAVSAAGGVSEEMFLKKIEEQLEFLGSHWDFSRDLPEKNKGIHNPWSKGVGEILKVYYQLEEKKLEIKQINEKLDELIELNHKLTFRKTERERLLEEQKQLRTIQLGVEKKAFLLEQIRQLEGGLEQKKAALEEWPKLLQENRLVQQLEAELLEKNKREQAKALKEVIRQVEEALKKKDDLMKNMQGLEQLDADLQVCREAMGKLKVAKSTLSGVRMHTKITLLSDKNAELFTAEKDKILVTDDFEQDVQGFARILFPDVAEIIVSPGEINVDQLQKSIELATEKVEAILEKYHAENIDRLEKMQKQLKQDERACHALEVQISGLLGNTTLTEKKEQLDHIKIQKELSIREGLEETITFILQARNAISLEQRKTVVSTKLMGYEAEYGTVDDLEKSIQQIEERRKALRADIEQMADIHMTKSEYDERMAHLEMTVNGTEIRTGIAGEIENLIAAVGALTAETDDYDLENLERELDELKQRFEARKKRYQQYIKIKSDFLDLWGNQEQSFLAFYKTLNHNLDIVTGGMLELSVDGNTGKTEGNRKEQPEEGVRLISHGNQLTSKELLSKGTRQAILLAFRLALLSYYYEERGVLILDDILLDMDPTRREQAVKLLQEFSEHNQVIFTTCDPGMAKMLGGKLIRL